MTAAIDRRWGRAFALGAALLLATAYVATAFALRSFTPMAAATWRGLLSTALLLPLVLLEGRGARRQRLDRPAALRLLVLGLFGGLGLIVGMNLSIAWAGPTIASFCVALASVLAALLAPLLLGEGLRKRAVAGFGVAMLGTAMITGIGGGNGTETVQGVIAGLFSAVCFACFLVLSRRWAARGGLGDAAVALSIAATIGIGLLFVELLLDARALVPGDVRQDAALGLIWLAVLPGVGAQILIVASSRRLAVSSSAALLMIKPAATAVFAFLLLGEVMLPVQFAGMGLVLAGIALAEAQGRSPGVPSRAETPRPGTAKVPG